MALGRHIWLLTQKNFIIIKRSKLWLFFELLFGMLMIPLFLFIVNKSGSEVVAGRNFESVIITGDAFDLDRSVPNIQRISTAMGNLNKTLAFVTPNEVGDMIMNKFEKRYQNYKFSVLTKKFESLEKMVQALNDDLNSTSTKMFGQYMGGIHIKELDVANKKLDYRIFVRDREGKDWHTDQFWPDDGPYGALADLNSIPSNPNYWSNGYLTFKYCLDSLFLEEVGRNLTDFYVRLARFPTPKFRNNALLAVLKAMPILFIILVLGIMIHTAKEIVAEKEDGIKTHLMVMGLNSIAFYISHFITGALKMLLIMGISALILSFGFISISPVVFILFCLLFGVAAIVFSILVSVLFRRTSLAVAAVIFLWFGLFAIDSHWKLYPTKIGVSALQSLNVFTAFHFGLLAMGRYESRLLDLNLLNIFAESYTIFSLGYSFVMLIVDILIMVILIYYLDAVWPTDDSPKRHPLFFLPIKRRDSFAEQMDLESNVNEFSDNCETDHAGVRDEADIAVKGMCKVWEGGQIAVDGLNLNAYRGQVTVLLGHNGAGKSTTFAVISGISSSTRGEVFICKKAISQHLSECQQEIGYCPQYNPLFEKLTVEEHLRLYGKLKIENWNEETERTMKSLIGANQLTTKANELAGNLSGGMKRKLCVAMALIGNSKVILLDEPTAGMDPEARHEICKVLEQEKKNRTILLTTHYMDEADLLGDQIAIMVKGRLVCKGSPEFLKNRFGTGYVLTMVIDPINEKYTESELEQIRKTLLHVVKKHMYNATIDSSTGLQFYVILPTGDKSHFANLFEELETEKTALHLSSFGLSFNTLEQVFLKVGEIAESQDDEVDSGGVISRACALFGRTDDEITQKTKEVAVQVWAIVYRYMISAYRNKIRTIFPLALAVLLFLFVAFVQIQSGKIQKMDLSLNALEPVTIPIQLNQETPSVADFPFIAGKLTDSVILSVPKQNKFAETVIQHSYDSPALGIGAFVAANGTAFAYFNGAAYHGPALAMSFLSNAILQERADSIKTSIEIYTADTADFDFTPVTTIFTNILTILCFSFLTCMFVMPLVEDRESRFKHQLLLTKLDKLKYWFAVTLWNAIIYVVFCTILVFIIFVSGTMQACMGTNILFWALYFWCAVPFVYVASFVFKSPFKAFVALLTWNIIAGIIASIAVTIFIALGSTELSSYFVAVFSIILPSFALGHGVVEVAMQCPILGRIVNWDELNKVIICMVISGSVFWFVLIMFERTFADLAHALMNKLHGGYNEIDQVEDNEDEDVQAERHRMSRVGDQDLALSVRDVSKFFGSSCVLRKLTFGVNPNDCFGLLGVNGAGKTTTFDILTGRTLATKGKAFIGGTDIKNMPVIGYCPQFDALALDLTGRQTLSLLGNLNGFIDVPARVNCVLDCIQMAEQADKLVMHYSGGQKRRLSIGVTLMSRASLIMLDEPTAGIDPKTRRHIWNLLSAIRDKKVAILLTSHSMDECEALCSRIGFLNKGSLISIGTSQHLKSRYGNSFLLTFTVANPSLNTKSEMDAIVVREFGAEPTQDVEYVNNYHWEVPRKGSDSWSNLYRRAQSIAEKYASDINLGEQPVIRDFSVTQNSLEQVFLRLTQVGTCGSDNDDAQDSGRNAQASSNIPA